MARQSNKNKAFQNKQLWDRSNNVYRQKWQTVSQQGFDFYLNDLFFLYYLLLQSHFLNRPF